MPEGIRLQRTRAQRRRQAGRRHRRERLLPGQRERAAADLLRSCRAFAAGRSPMPRAGSRSIRCRPANIASCRRTQLGDPRQSATCIRCRACSSVKKRRSRKALRTGGTRTASRAARQLSRPVSRQPGKKAAGHEFFINGRMDGQFWSARARPDKDGTVTVRLPHGLQDVQVMLRSPMSTAALRHRKGPGKPIENHNYNVRARHAERRRRGLRDHPLQGAARRGSERSMRRAGRSGTSASRPISVGTAAYILAGEQRSDMFASNGRTTAAIARRRCCPTRK